MKTGDQVVFDHDRVRNFDLVDVTYADIDGVAREFGVEA